MENLLDSIKSINILVSLLYTLIGALGGFVGWFVVAYNGLVQRRRRADEAWANIATELKRRYDLIPNLVKTVEGYAAHEKGVLENVTKARAAAMAAKNPGEASRAEGMLGAALGSFFALVENYPALKANENFLALQRELAEAENRTQETRKVYNDAARDLNVKIESIPSNFVAAVFRFKKAEFFTIEEKEKEVPRVSFGT